MAPAGGGDEAGESGGPPMIPGVDRSAAAGGQNLGAESGSRKRNAVVMSKDLTSLVDNGEHSMAACEDSQTILMEIEELRAQLDVDVKQLGYCEGNQKLRLELVQKEKERQCLRKQNEEMQSKNDGMRKQNEELQISTQKKKARRGDDWDTAVAAARSAETVERGGAPPDFKTVDRTWSPAAPDSPAAREAESPQPVLRRSRCARTQPTSPPASSAHGGRKRPREEPTLKPQLTQRSQRLLELQQQAQEERSSEDEQSSSESEPELIQRLPTVGEIRRASGRLVQEYRCTEDREDWFPHDREIPGPFYTELQRIFHRAFYSLRTLPYDHRQILLTKVAPTVGITEEQLRASFSYLPGVVELLELPGRYVTDWIEVFYATVWISPTRDRICYMFGGEAHTLYREDIAGALRVELRGDKLHELCHPLIRPPRQRQGTRIVPPSSEMVSICFKPPFSHASPRHPSDLTLIAHTILEILRRTILLRSGYREAISALQQWVLSYIMQRHDFDIVDFLLCEIEDTIADGMKAGRRLPYAHYLSHILARADPEAGPQLDVLHRSRRAFPAYRPAKASDWRRGHRATMSAQQSWTEEQRQQGAAEVTGFRSAEHESGLEGFLQIEYVSDDSSDEDYIPNIPLPSRPDDHEAPTPTQSPPAPESPQALSQSIALMSQCVAQISQCVAQTSHMLFAIHVQQTQQHEAYLETFRAIQQQQSRMLDHLEHSQWQSDHYFQFLYDRLGVTPPPYIPHLGAPIALRPSPQLLPTSQGLLLPLHTPARPPPYSPLWPMLSSCGYQPRPLEFSPLPYISTSFCTPRSVLLGNFSAQHSIVSAFPPLGPFAASLSLEVSYTELTGLSTPPLVTTTPDPSTISAPSPVSSSSPAHEVEHATTDGQITTTLGTSALTVATTQVTTEVVVAVAPRDPPTHPPPAFDA